MPKERPQIPLLKDTHHQRWRFSRYSYLDEPRPNHGLLLMLSGDMEYVFEGGKLHLKPMDMVYLPKGSCYEVRIHPGTDDLLLNFDFEEGEGTVFPQRPQIVLRDELHALQPLMEQIVRLDRTEDGFWEAMATFYRFCHQVSVVRQSKDSDSALIQRAKVLLADPDCDSLENVAKQLLVSPSGLRKKFKDAEGISPARYRMLQRVDRATRLLISTDLTISQIAQRCGFCDEAYFHKVFCKTVGMTPSAYRNVHYA